jgi:Zn-dependent alcohol dehydrogenase
VGSVRFVESTKQHSASTIFSTILAVVESTALNHFRQRTRGELITFHVFGQSSFAKHILVHENDLVKIGKKVPFHNPAALVCGNMTGVGGKSPLIAGPNIENEGPYR